MDNCTLKILLIIVCVIIVLVGLFLAFKREKKNIADGNPDLQDGGGSFKDGKINFKFAIGLVLIIIGVIGAFYSIKELPGCGEQKPVDSNILSLEILDRTAKIRDLLSADSKQFNDTLSPSNIRTVWTSPNDFSIQQVLALSDIDPNKVIQSLVSLLSDANVTVSSGAVIAISKTLSKTIDNSKRTELISLIPKIEKRNFKINLNGAKLENQDLRPLKETDIFYGAELNDASFSKSKLDSITFKTASANYCKFVQASLKGCVFDMAHLEGSVFWGASAPQSSFRLAFLKNTDFSQHKTTDKEQGILRTSTSYIPANLEGADFGDAQLYGTNFSGARIGNANFNGSSLSKVNFVGSFLIGMSQNVNEEYIHSLGTAAMDSCIFK